MVNLIIGTLILIVWALLIIPTAVAFAVITLKFADWSYDWVFKEDDEE